MKIPGNRLPLDREALSTAMLPALTGTSPRVRVVLPPSENWPELLALVTKVAVKMTEPAVGVPAPKPGCTLTVAVADQWAP